MSDAAPAPAAYQPEAFGKFYLVDRIATGGMAEIFKAKSYSTAGFEKVLVIKRILAHLSENDEFVSMFIDEAKISVSLQHSNLVQIYDFGKIRENYFIAMEWIDGRDVKMILRKLAERRKLLPEEFAVFIAHEVCKGLDYAHKKTDINGVPLGIIHRDMSPSNVLVSYSGEVKVADFGIAKAEMSTYTTKDGVLKGKFEYMSPEQARGEDLTQQSDIFSAGIILWEMLTGRRLFKSDSEIKTLERIKSGDIKPPSAVNPNIPQRLDEIVMKALSGNLQERYADAREFQAALLDYMYPSTPPVTQRSLSVFLEELFETERQDENRRFTEASKLALEMHQRQPDVVLSPDWEERGSPSATIAQPPPARWPLAVAAVVVFGLLGVVGFLVTRDPETQVQVKEVEVLPTEGALKLNITPVEGSVFVGGKPAGQGTLVLVDHLTPGPQEISVGAPGYEAWKETVDVAAGERLVLRIALEKEKPEAAPRPAERPVDTQPKVDPPKETPKVEPPKETPKVDPPKETPKAAPEAAGKGKVSVTLTGRQAWADVYLDGKNIGRTPRFNWEVPAGKHTVRVVNEQLGLDESKSISVDDGETEKVSFQVQ